MARLIIKSSKGYKLTRAGLSYVTHLLEDGGYFGDVDMTGFEVNRQWAGIMGTYMVEAAQRYMTEMGKKQKSIELSEDEESELALVALYAAIAQAEVDRSMF